MNLDKIANKLLKEKKVAIFCHIRPDGDALGSSCALKLALCKKGIRAEVFCYDAVPERFNFLKEILNVKKEFSGEFTAFVAVDCADLERLGGFAEIFLAQKNTYNIDHHISNKNYAAFNCVIDRASNSENVCELIECLGIPFDSEIADLLALGILTDTGNFRHKNVTSETFVCAAQMVGYGADLNNISYNMFTAQSKERAKLFGMVMSRIRYFMEDKIAVASVMLEDFESTNAKPDETEGFIDFVMGIKGVEVGACVMQIGAKKFKVSLRSKSADVNKVAATFGGGGHVLAAGCQLNGEYEEVIDKLSFAISRYIDE